VGEDTADAASVFALLFVECERALAEADRLENEAEAQAAAEERTALATAVERHKSSAEALLRALFPKPEAA